MQGRALWFASQYASILPPHLIKEFLTASNTVLENPNTGPVAFVFALKTIRSFCAFLPKEVLAPYQAGLLESMARWMGVAQDEALILLLETLVLVVKIGNTQYEHVIGPLLVNVWSRGTNGGSTL